MARIARVALRLDREQQGGSRFVSFGPSSGPRAAVRSWVWVWVCARAWARARGWARACPRPFLGSGLGLALRGGKEKQKTERAAERRGDQKISETRHQKISETRHPEREKKFQRLDIPQAGEK